MAETLARLATEPEPGVPLTAEQLKARLALIQAVMRDVMQEGIDYGTIPGTDKPTLLKPGAEKLCVTFRLAPDDPGIEAVPAWGDEIRYRVRVPIKSNGTIVAVGIGECSTGEEKYRWRRPVHVNEYNAAPEDQRRVKWTRKGEQWQQVRVHPSDVANTILKMAHKRAYVHAVIMATAAGSIFTQDAEDLPEGLHDTPTDEHVDQRRAPIHPPQRKADAPPPTPAEPQTVRFKVKGIFEDPQHSRVLIRAEDGRTFFTTNPTFVQAAKDAQAAGLEVEVTFVEGRSGREIQQLVEVAREPGAEG